MDQSHMDLSESVVIKILLDNDLSIIVQFSLSLSHLKKFGVFPIIAPPPPSLVVR